MKKRISQKDREEIFELISVQNWTQTDVAAKFGVTQSCISENYNAIKREKALKRQESELALISGLTSDLVFSPYTGKPLFRFDPYTGKPLFRFDPYTGKRINS